MLPLFRLTVFVEVASISVFLLLSALAHRSHSARTNRMKPAYQLRFEVSYVTSSSSNTEDVTRATGHPVSNRCGEYYATTLLHNFIQLSSWLNGLCFETTVKINHKAVVYIRSREVKVDTNVTLNLTNPNEGGSVNMINCSLSLNRTLQTIGVLDEKLQENNSKIQMISLIEGKGDCSQVTMNPRRFILSHQEWICPETYTYSKEKWECYRDSYPIDQTPNTDRHHSTTSRQQRTTSSSVYFTSSSPKNKFISNDFLATVVPVALTTETTIPGPKHWGIEALKNVSRIHLTEGNRVFELPVRIWYNDSILCQNEPICRISMVVSFAASTDHPEPVCRRTGLSIPQLTLSRPVVSGTSENNYCTLYFPPNQTVIEGGQLFLKAVVDHKYDEMQTRYLRLSLVRLTASEIYKEMLFEIPVLIEDRDKKATCQSINDPHITTFDGFEYNNFYEGEFILYRHQTLPFSVHAIYQKCYPDLPASCNCGVAVQSGDDVIIIDRCFRRRLSVPTYRSRWSPDSAPRMSVQLYLNGNLTPGTRIHEDADGKKYLIYLPHGAYVKVIASGQLVNLWIVPSPNDLYMTEGLCGIYDFNRRNDIHLRNGTVLEDVGEFNSTERPQPAEFIRDWSVEMGTAESLFHGLPSASKPYEPGKYCICDADGNRVDCDYSADISRCDIYQGKDVTRWLVDRAITQPASSLGRRRILRDIHDNSVLTGFDDEEPVVIDKQFVPPKSKWKNNWNEVNAKDFCQKYIKDDYRIGQLCSQIPSVNFKQEIDTCDEDIKITGNTSWADSARDAMKEQCLEEVQKNGSLPNDIVRQISDEMCINDCSGHGQCRNGTCHCFEDYTSADCSMPLKRPPYVSDMPRYGLCDIRYMNCERVIVYGGNFIDSPNLTCHLQECKMTDLQYEPLNVTTTLRAIFINFNAVECPIPYVHIFLIRISNNGLNTSDPLLFIPFDSVCNSCNVFNTTCPKRRNSCIIDGKCYREGEKSPADDCLICKTYDDEYQWTTVTDNSCHHSWWEAVHLPDWVVALCAAIGGSLIGVFTGFLLYRCCFRSKKSLEVDDVTTGRPEVQESSVFEADSFLHRNRGIPTFVGNPFSDLDLCEPEIPETTSMFYNDGQGVENGVDSTTYF